MKFFKRAFLGLSLFLIILCGAIITWYYLQGPSQQGLVHSDFADRPFQIEDLVNVKPVTNKPNIVFILADDLGYGDVSYNKQTSINTKNLDKLASQSVVFSNFYAPLLYLYAFAVWLFVWQIRH